MATSEKLTVLNPTGYPPKVAGRPLAPRLESLNGAPRMRQVFVPHPVMGKTAEELRAYIEGNDPLSGRPVMQEVIEGLTEVLTPEDVAGLSFERSTPRLCEPATEEGLANLFLE